MDAKIIPDSIRDVLNYDPETGDLTWKINSKRARAGAVAGWVHNNGYRMLCANQVTYLAHRVAWFLHHGTQPNVIDHVNRDRADNRLANLRDVNISLNGLNSSRTGVKWAFSNGARYVRASYRGRALYMGKDITTAWFRRIMAERQDHPIGLPAPV